MLDSINNFWGWQVTAPDIVRSDQWQEFADVYVRDKYQLGLKDWFERANPAAAAQMIERMLEAVRKDYWQADAATVRELAQRYQELAGQIRRAHRQRAFQRTVAARQATGLPHQPSPRLSRLRSPRPTSKPAWSRSPSHRRLRRRCKASSSPR